MFDNMTNENVLVNFASNPNQINWVSFLVYFTANPGYLYSLQNNGDVFATVILFTLFERNIHITLLAFP